MPCSICFEEFNKTSRHPTKCPYCPIETCRTCLQTYLLGDISDVPRCINPECEHGYSREFLDSQLTQSFRLHTYKKHREKVLIDRERSRLPSTQQEAQAYKTASVRAKELDKKIQPLQKAIVDLYTDKERSAQRLSHRYDVMQYRLRANPTLVLPPNMQIDQLDYINACKTIKIYKTKLAPLKKELRIYKTEFNSLRPIMNSYGIQPATTNTTTNTITHEPRQAFVKACPATDCKGFLSTAWKCGMCELWSCPECHELKGVARETEHTCDPNKVLTVQLLNKEAKSCPKCGVQICKIEGCDQMWCTSCNTGFNWRSGKIAQGPVHNPHYFEYLRSQGLNPTRQPAQGDCDYETDRSITRALDTRNEENRYLLEVWRIMRHHQDYRNMQQDNEEKFRQLRVRFMAGEIQEEDWKIALQRLEKNLHFQRANNQIKDVFVSASRDLIRQILEPDQNRETVKQQVKELLEYCNTSAEQLSKRFHRQAQKYVPRLIT